MRTDSVFVFDPSRYFFWTECSHNFSIGSFMLTFAPYSCTMFAANRVSVVSITTFPRVLALLSLRSVLVPFIIQSSTMWAAVPPGTSSWNSVPCLNSFVNMFMISLIFQFPYILFSIHLRISLLLLRHLYSQGHSPWLLMSLG